MLLKYLSIVLLSLSLVSCGGGGGGGGSSGSDGGQDVEADLLLPAGWRKIDTAPWA